MSFLTGNSEVMIDVNTHRYVHTEILEEAVDVLEEQGLVVLCGPPGTGKTTLAKAILRRFRDKGFTPYVLSKMEEWHAYVGEGRKSVVLLDGTLGQVRVHRQQHDYWESILAAVLELTAQGHCKLVLTLYPHVLREVRQLERGTQSPLLDPSLFVHMPDTLDRDVKEALLHFHLKELHLDPDEQRRLVEKILQKDVSGPVFPWCCGQLFHKWQSSDDPTAIFTVPAEAYVTLLTRMLSDPDHGETFAAVLALAMKGLGGFLRDPHHVQPHLRELRFCDYSEYRLEEHANPLKGFILTEDGCGFTSRVLYDAAGLALGRYFSLPILLQVCDVDFLVNYVRLHHCEFSVHVGKDESDRRLVLQRITHGTTGNLPNRQLSCLLEQVLSDVFADTLSSHSSDNTGFGAQYSPKDLANMKFEIEMKEKLKLSLALRASPSSAEANPHIAELTRRVRSNRVRYLDNPSLPIPGTLLTVTVTEDAVSLELPGQHWYLVLRLLADREVDETDENGDTVLHIAADTGNPQAIKLAVKSGASLVVKNNRGLTPYQLAQRREKTRKCSRIPPKYRDVHTACREGQLDTVKVALCHSVSVNDKGENYNTPLHSACSSGRIEVASLLLSLGADVSARQEQDQTPLYSACHHGNVAVVSLLLNHGADASTSCEGLTPFHRACMNGHTEVVRLLVQRGADINVKGRFDYTALHLACWHGHADIVRLLLRHRADVHAKNVSGTTPMDIALMYGHRTLVDLLFIQPASSSAGPPSAGSCKPRKGVLSKLFG